MLRIEVPNDAYGVVGWYFVDACLKICNEVCCVAPRWAINCYDVYMSAF